MHTHDEVRRRLLIEGTAAVALLALGRQSVAAGTPSTSSRESAGTAARSTGAPRAASPAAAAGTITIGKDLVVNRLGFGAMRVTGEGIWGPPEDREAAIRLLRRVVELGVDFIDTADSYGPGTSEELIAAALHPYPRGLVIATKGGIVRPAREQWERDGRPQHLREACEASLKRLRLERIDLYQLHAIDPQVPLEESLGELSRLQKEGKIRHVGVSNFKADELERARRIVDVVSVQNRYNVADRSSDPVLAACERDGIAFIPWSPLSQGPRDAGAESRAKLEALAAKRGVSVPHAAVAWLLARSKVMLPIPGTSKVKHLEDNVAAAAMRLTPEEMREIG
ncbi:MAG: aldo/keto reductase [Lysobacterales bacterium]|jgi:aryl-alcohol dehydrogenase-like predicted oxidoreductase|nr:MAG: aldo/keto reductase [Xanthomonadales bacterium]